MEDNKKKSGLEERMSDIYFEIEVPEEDEETEEPEEEGLP
jgi:hypothetical protein